MATPDLTRARPNGARGIATRLATETKQFFKTSEFYVFLAIVVGILIAANSVEGEEGGVDFFNARHAWLYITILAAAYMLSRGLAKAGSRDPYWESSGDNRSRDGDES